MELFTLIFDYFLLFSFLCCFDEKQALFAFLHSKKVFWKKLMSHMKQILQLINGIEVLKLRTGRINLKTIAPRARAVLVLLPFIFALHSTCKANPIGGQKTRIIITTDGEIDDECSLVRCLLYANDFDIEAIVTTSSQYHWQGHKWAGDDWAQPYLKAYKEVYPNLLKHDNRYPTPEYLQARTLLGNVELKVRWKK